MNATTGKVEFILDIGDAQWVLKIPLVNLPKQISWCYRQNEVIRTWTKVRETFKLGWYQIDKQCPIRYAEFGRKPKVSQLAHNEWFSHICVYINEVRTSEKYPHKKRKKKRMDIRQDDQTTMHWIWGNIDGNYWLLMQSKREQLTFARPVKRTMRITKDPQKFRKKARMKNQIGTPEGKVRVANLLVRLKFDHCWSLEFQQTVAAFLKEHARVRVLYKEFRTGDKVRFRSDEAKNIYTEATVSGAKNNHGKYPVCFDVEGKPHKLKWKGFCADELILMKTTSNEVYLNCMCGNSWQAQQLVKAFHEDDPFPGKVQAGFLPIPPNGEYTPEEKYSVTGMMLVSEKKTDTFVDESPISAGAGALIKIGPFCYTCVDVDENHWWLMKWRDDQKVNSFKVKRTDESKIWTWHLLTTPLKWDHKKVDPSSLTEAS